MKSSKEVQSKVAEGLCGLSSDLEIFQLAGDSNFP